MPDHKPHIDGLRALAVMGVILFHFGAAWLPGGFVGVDVFFVISGFLISGSIYRDLERGRFSIVEFYERRARRIMPALLVVTAVSAVAAYYLLYPVQLLEFSRSVVAALTFTSNIYFYATADYFAPSATQIPLLHYWSLGVEEQFYIIFPLAAWALFRMRQKFALAALIIACVLSLAASQVMLTVSPDAAFYQLPFRAFELLIGCIIARSEVRSPANAWVSAGAVGSGILIILGAMFVLNEHMAFPGVLALVPCLGTALVIWGADRRPTVVSRALGRGPFGFLGAISYSLYLVHWPVFVFFFNPNRDWIGAQGVLVFGVAVSIVLAWLSYRYVEQPFRLRRVYWTRSKIFSASTAGMVFLGIGAAFTIQQRGFPARLDNDLAAMLEWRNYNPTAAFRGGKCFLEPTNALSDYDESMCLPADGQRSIVLWGDSAIAHYYTGFSEALGSEGINVGQLTSSLCAPILHNDVPSRPLCQGFNNLAYDKILKGRPDLLVIGASWDTRPEVMAKLGHTLDLLRSEGLQVIVFGQPPYYKAPVPEIMAKRMVNGNQSTLSGADLDYETLRQADDVVRDVVAKRPGIAFISILEKLCPAGQCPMAHSSVPLLFDPLHLTPEGSKYFASRLLPYLRASPDHAGYHPRKLM